MPNIDISRDATDLRKHYDRVQMQQGRVLTDDDFNEADALMPKTLVVCASMSLARRKS